MARWKEPPNIIVTETTPIPPEKLEGLKRLIKKTALRKIKEMEETALQGSSINDLLYEPS